MAPVAAGHSRRVRIAAAVLALLVITAAGLCVPFGAAAQSPASPSIGRLGVRVTSPPASRTLVGSLYALDQASMPVADLSAADVQVSLDGAPAAVSLEGRPSIAVAVGFWLDSSASPQVREAAANALADGLQDIDVNRDTVAIDSTATPAGWDQSAFTSSATDLQQSLNAVIQDAPDDSRATLEQVSSVLRSLTAQPADTRVLLLFANRPLAGAGSTDASLGTLRGYAIDNAIQVSIVALPGAGGQAAAEALADATPGGGVEYVLNATNREDISRRVSLLLAPAFGAQRFEMPAPGEGSHTLSVGARGARLEATTAFQTVARPVPIASIETSEGSLTTDLLRNAARGMGVIALLALGELLLIGLFVRVDTWARGASLLRREFPPTLRLNTLAGRYVAPEVIEFPARGKLRIGLHPPLMDDLVGNRDFTRLPYKDIRGDQDVVKELGHHAACIWRDPRTNDCYIQLGWDGPGDRIEPRPQSRVFHFGRPQEATTSAFRLAHHDVVRLSTGVEFVFNQVGLRDKPAPEAHNASPLKLRSIGPGRISLISDIAPRSTVTHKGEV